MAVEGLVHGFSTRVGGVSRCYRPGLPEGLGDLNLGFTKDDDRANVRANRLRFLAAVGASGFNHFGLLVQQHTPTVHVLRSVADAATDFTQPAQVPGDGLITNVPGILLTVQAADCMPVLVFDPVRRVVGAFHAGWRGTVAGIVSAGVAAMSAEFGCGPADMIAAIGPGIGPQSLCGGRCGARGVCCGVSVCAGVVRSRDAVGFVGGEPAAVGGCRVVGREHQRAG